jgi:hypothetical protein
LIIIIAKLAANAVVFAANNWFFLWTADDIYRLDRALLFARQPASIFEHVWLPLPFIVQGTLSSFFHNPALTAAIINTLLSLLIIYFFFKVTELLGLDRRVFYLTSLIYICTPYYTWISLSALGEGYYFVSIAFWIYFYLKTLKTGLLKYKYLCAFFLLLATLVRYEAYMFVAVFLLSEAYFIIRDRFKNHVFPGISIFAGHYFIPGLISIAGIVIILTAYKIKHGSFFWSFDIVRYWQDTRYLNTSLWKKFLLLGSWLINLYTVPIIIFVPIALPSLKKRSPLAFVMFLLIALEFFLMSLVQAQSPVSCSHKHKVILVTNLLLLPFISLGFIRIAKKWKALKIPLWCCLILFFIANLIVSMEFRFQRTDSLRDIWNAGDSLLKETHKAVPNGKIMIELFPRLLYSDHCYMNDTLRLKYRFGDPRRVILDHNDYKSHAKNNEIIEFTPMGKGLFDIYAGNFKEWAERNSVVGIICTSEIHLKTITPSYKRIFKIKPYTLYARADLLDDIDRQAVGPYFPDWADRLREYPPFRLLYKLLKPQDHPYLWESFFISQ